MTNLNDSGPGSLRQAILEAAPNETITVPAGQIVLTSGALAITKSLTISGSGATVISGNDVSRVFTITAAPTVTLSGLTITHGKDPFGAGISAAGGTLTLQSVTVSNNRAGGGGTDGSGGGIEFTGAGTLSLIDSSVSENSAGGGALAAGFGGGIEYQPTGNAQAFSLALTRSQVAANHAGGGGTESTGFGGGIGASSGFESGSISIALTDTVLSGNVAGGAGIEASGFGGGLELSSGGAKNTLMLTLERTSITGNTAGGGGAESSGFGGGVDFSSGGAAVVQTLTAADSTIAGNSAGGGGAKADGFGGGIEFGTGTATLSHLTVTGNSAGGGGGSPFGGGLTVGSVGTGAISNSIVAGNPGGNCFTAIPSGGHNIDDGSTCGFKGSADKSGVDPKLGAPGGHPGPSLTQMPLAGSPAIDSADPATCPAIDQRGVTRPQGAGCDIGAVEVPPPIATTSSVSSVTSEAATVGGTVNPNFSATTYHFDFGTTTAYGNFTVAASAGEAGLAGAVSAALSKLKPATVYHFRLVASNAAGTVVGGDQTLTTRRATKPPSATPPRITGAGLTNKRFRVGRKSTAISARRAPVGTSFRFTLSARATVQVTITRSATGLRARAQLRRSNEQAEAGPRQALHPHHHRGHPDTRETARGSRRHSVQRSHRHPRARPEDLQGRAAGERCGRPLPARRAHLHGRPLDRPRREPRSPVLERLFRARRGLGPRQLTTYLPATMTGSDSPLSPTAAATNTAACGNRDLSTEHHEGIASVRNRHHESDGTAAPQRRGPARQRRDLLSTRAADEPPVRRGYADAAHPGADVQGRQGPTARGRPCHAPGLCPAVRPDLRSRGAG